MKYRLHLLLLPAFLISLSVAAQPVRVSASVSQQQILIGEPFQLTLRVEAAESQAIQWFVTDSFPHFEIQYRSAIDTVRSGTGQQILVQNIRLTSWDSGKWNLPTFALPRSNRTRPIAVTVSFSPMDPAQPYHEVKDVREVNRPAYRRWWWYLIGLALVLLLLLLLFPRSKKPKATAAPSPEGAYREAMKQLEGLEKRKSALSAKEFYTELTGVLRSYLVRRKDYQSPSKTSADLQQQLPAWGLTGSEGARLSETLQLSDAVKFARFEATVDERKASVAHVRDAIALMERVSNKGR